MSGWGYITCGPSPAWKSPEGRLYPCDANGWIGIEHALSDQREDVLAIDASGVQTVARAVEPETGLCCPEYGPGWVAVAWRPLPPGLAETAVDVDAARRAGL